MIEHIVLAKRASDGTFTGVFGAPLTHRFFEDWTLEQVIQRFRAGLDTGTNILIIDSLEVEEYAATDKGESARSV